jgi:membrane associated rhomboid family serine protease
MRPARSGGGLSGFRLPEIRSFAVKLAITVIGLSLIMALTVPELFLLTPGLVVHNLFLWLPVSYAFVETSPTGVIFAALVLWQIGQPMEVSWGVKRFAWFTVGGTVLAGIITVLVSLVLWQIRGAHFAGAWVMGTMVWCAYGFGIGRGQTNFWGMPLSGNMFAGIGILFVILHGAFSSFLAVIPDLLGVAFAYAYVRGFSPRLIWLRFQSWRLQNQLKGRSKHLKVISQDRNMPSDSDRFLH